MSRLRFLLAFGLVTLLLAGVISFYASASPDGLERVASDRGFVDTADDHALAGSPLADYGTRGVDDARVSGGIAGMIGVGVTLIVAGGLFFVVRRRPQQRPRQDA